MSGSSTDYREYEYNSSGSVEEIFDITGSNPVSIEKLRWDENQVLTGVSNENGYHHYLYDHNGIRVMKSSILEVSVQEGGGEEGGTALALDPYTVYVNPYYIEINYSDAFEYSKHYYNGSQRISTKQDVDEQSVSYTMDDPLINGEKDLHLFLTDFLELVEEEDFVLEDLLTAPSYESYYGPSPCDNEEFYDPEDEEAIAECMCKYDPIAALLQEIDCDEYDVQYWYHPDYASAALSTGLDHTEIVSDANGDAYQYWCLPRPIRGYAPFGETIVEEHANNAGFSSRYLFNAKELDPETGRYYYGARYYDPDLSIWLSVDPLAANFPHLTPYSFTENNPINMIDPDGRSAQDGEGSGLKMFFEKLGNFLTFKGWNEDPEPGFELLEVEIIDPNTSGEVCSACPQEKKQNYGEDQWGENDEQGIRWPDADKKGDPQEMFPMTGSGKASGGIGEKIAKGLNLLRKWVSWGSKDEIPSQSLGQQDAPPASPPVAPVPERPQPANNDTTINIQTVKWGGRSNATTPVTIEKEKLDSLKGALNSNQKILK